MVTTSVFGHGGLATDASADVEFVHGAQVDSDVQFLWDLDHDGDFDSDEEDVTSYVYEAECVSGRDWPSQLQGKAGPGRLQLRLRNDDDRFSYFNSDSPLNQGGRSLDPGRKVRVRAKVQRAALMSGGGWTTPDHADLDVTGDLTIGADFDPEGLTGSIQTLVSKWNGSGNQRSAMLQVTASRFPRLIHSPDGTLASQIITTSTVPLGSDHRQAVWVSIDVNNEAAGRTVNFYTAATIDDEPELLSSVTTAGTTSIFNSTTAVAVGIGFGLGGEEFTGVFYAAEWTSGLITSTDYRARPDFRPLAVGATSFTDEVGRAWGDLSVPGATTEIVDDPASVDPVLLARDRFDSTLALEEITADELGNAWTPRSIYDFVKGSSQEAIATTEGGEHLLTLDVGVPDYYVQMTVSELGSSVDEDSGFQEVNDTRLIYRWQDSSNYSYLRFGPGDGVQNHTFEGVDVVAGTPSSIFGPFSFTGSNADDSPGDHRDRITIGVHVTGAEANYYINGCHYGTETALQTDETEVGIYAYWGVGNTRPRIDEFAVWDRFPSETKGVIWTGYVTDVVPEATPGGPKVVTVTAEGALTILATNDVEPAAWAGQLFTGVCLGDALERAGLLYPPGELLGGEVQAGSSSGAQINALTHVRKLEEVEIGFLHEAPEGWLIYRDRDYREGLTTEATFSDAEGAQFQYTSLELLNWRRELINRVTAGVSRGAPDLVTGGFTTGATASGVNRTISWTFPASNVEDGDLFVIIITSTVANNNENWLVPIFWVRERDTGASSSKLSQVYTHIAGASEAGTSVTFYNDAANAGGSFVLHYIQIRNWYGSHEGIHLGTWARGESFAGADPETILPPWGDTNPSYFSAYRAGVSTGAAGSISANPTYPLGYTNTASQFQNGSGSNIHDAGLQEGSKLAMTAVEDPSTFAGFSGLNNAEAAVIAVRGYNGSPPESQGRYRVTVEDQDSQRKHGLIATYDGCDLFASEDAAEEWCGLMLTRYANVRPIVRLSFPGTLSGAYRAQAYKRRLSDKVRVVATGGAGMGIDGDFHVENVRHRWSSAGKVWEVTWELSPA